MAQAEPDRAYLAAFDIGMNVVTAEAREEGIGTAVLDFLLRWGSEAGYRYCTVGWTSSNLASDSFYRSRGFLPTRYRVHRRVDARVAWANEHFDYTPFRR
jgi:ribosomal protein S18 acetylase RimI-like enzyme